MLTIAPRPLFPHDRRDESRRSNRVQEDEVESVVPLVVRDVEQVASCRVSGVVHERVDASVSFRRGLDQRGEVVGVRHGAFEPDAAEVLGDVDRCTGFRE